MSKAVKDDEGAPPVVDVQLELLNISGRKAGKSERRGRISEYLSASADKPDFLALVDNVARIDVDTFCAALDKRWIEAKYQDMAYEWTGNHYSNVRVYTTNHEALIYDSNIWEYLDRTDLPIKIHDLSEFGHLVWNRFRAGGFRHKGTDQVVYVVTYHGPHKPPKGSKRHNSLDETKKQKCFSEFVETLLNKLEAAKLSPEPSIFICGDFNFNVGREACSQFLRRHKVKDFPHLSQREPVGGYSYNPLDYILTRGSALSISHCGEYNILRDDGRVWSSPCFPIPLTLSVPIEKLGHDIETLLEEVSYWKRAPRAKILDSECYERLTRFELTNALIEEDTDVKRRESTPLKDMFDHNFIRMHARLGVGSDNVPQMSSPEASDSDFRYKSPRPQPASALLTITLKPDSASRLQQLFSEKGEIWSHKSLWLRLRMEAISVRAQRRLHKFVNLHKQGDDGETRLKIRLKDV